MLLLGTPGWAELALIAFIILLLFGKNRLPALAKSVGSGIHEFKKGLNGQMDFSDEEEPEEIKPVKKIAAAQKTTKTTAAKKTRSKKA